jgi:hypothetical protein
MQKTRIFLKKSAFPKRMPIIYHHLKKFSGKASNYQAYCPEYPVELYDWFVNTLENHVMHLMKNFVII